METETDNEHLGLVNRLYNRKRIDPSAFRRYRILSYRDFGDESRWLGAPILVFTERERLTLQHSAAVRFARVAGVAVIRWRTQCSEWHQQPNPQHRETALADPCFYEYFVEGAESTLRDDVDAEVGLSTGVHVRYHSLTLKSNRQEKTLERKIAAAAPGDVITLPHAPKLINVKVDSSCVPKCVRQKLSLTYPKESGQYIVPLGEVNASAHDDGVHTIVPGGNYFKPSIALLHRCFPVVPNFVLTVKAASQFTFNRVILAISARQDHKATHEDLYHALSRVSTRQDIRLLLRGETVADKWRSLEYVASLKPDAAPWAKPGLR